MGDQTQNSDKSEKMTGSRTFAERAEKLEDKEHKDHKESGLSGLGAQLSNTQILENEMGDKEGKKDDLDPLDDENFEIDLLDEDGDSPFEPELKRSGTYASEGNGNSGGGVKIKEDRPLPPIPPPRSHSLTTDPNLRQAFRGQKPTSEMTAEELEIAATFEKDREHASRIPLEKKSGSDHQADEEWQSADEGDPTFKERFKASKTECEILRNRVFQLEKELKETQDFVFSMQPRASRLTESDALAEFNSLCGSVEEWVQTKLGDSIEAMTQGKERVPLGQPVKIMLGLIPPAGREAFRYRDTDEYNITALIMRCICDWLLDRDFYCNIEKGGMDFLHSIEKAMRNLEPRRDHITCRTWRAETYLAITNRHSFATFHSKLREQVAYDLTHILHIFNPRADDEVLGASIVKSIVDPALALAHKLHLSVDKYSIRWSPYFTANWEQRQTMNLDLSQFECVDLIGGRTIKFPPKGKLLTYIFDLQPGLVLETAQAQFYGEPKILKKPKILVAATKEDDGFYNPQLPRPGDPFTLLGWMEEKIQARSNRFVF